MGRGPKDERQHGAMDSLFFFLKGLGAGFVVAAPVGPVAVMCVRRTMTHGPVAGYVTGLGAALADTFYGVVAAFGIGFIADLMLDNEFWFRLVGGIVLLIIAAKTMLSGVDETQPRRSQGLFRDFLSALVVTGTNPITVVAFGAVFAAIGAVAAGATFDWAESLVAGVFVGSALWWLLLTGIAGALRGAVSDHGLRWINRSSAAVIGVSGIVVLAGALAPNSSVAHAFELPFG